MNKQRLSDKDFKQRICVIGAGPGGLTTLRALQSLDQSKFEVVCFERYNAVGGIWNFTGAEKVEPDGIEKHSGMYHNLITNNPKEVTELPELLHPKGTPCYPGQSYILDYLKKYADKFELGKVIKFQTWVDRVAFHSGSQKFKVMVRDLKEAQSANILEEFDYVIVATGHFNYPRYAEHPGLETFPGLQIHSKYFMDASRYKGKRILLIGNSFSAEDIALQCAKNGAEHVTIAYKVKLQDFKYPNSITLKPMVHMVNKEVSFTDGSSEKFDVIIHCTGYKHEFPFLEENLQLKTPNRLAMPLYEGIVFPNNHKLFYIGMQNQVYTFTMFWLQAQVVVKFITGELRMPSDETVRREIEKHQADELCEVKDIFTCMDFQSKYVRHLEEITGNSKCDATEILRQWQNDKMEDIKTFKEKSHFKSRYA